MTLIPTQDLRRVCAKLLPTVPMDLGDDGVRAFTRSDMMRAIATGYLAGRRDEAMPTEGDK